VRKGRHGNFGGCDLRSGFKTNDLGWFLRPRLMLKKAAEPLFTPVQGNLVKESAAG
jgi:hypothetical protein